MRRSHKPIAILQHTVTAAPGMILAVLDQLGLAWRLYSLANEDMIPTAIDEFSGLISLGGAMSANDDLPWIQTEVALMLEAYNKNIPIAAHCLGAQILAKALGAVVRKNKYQELGWVELEAVNSLLVEEWFGVTDKVIVFQWHGETFDLPMQAVPLLSSEHCANQAYVLENKHIALQFHLEMTAELIEYWIRVNPSVIARELAAHNPAVMSKAQIRQCMDNYLFGMHQMLLHMYKRWAKNL